MAKFTSTRDLNVEYFGHSLRGPAGTVFRLPDSLRQPFQDDFGTRIPIAWVVSDEISAASGGSSGPHPDFADHLTIGLSAASVVQDHLSAGDPHVLYALDADLANHEGDGHPGLYAAPVHTHAISSTTNLQTTLDGKAASSHSHVDADIPAGIARDSEVTSAIASHEGAANPHPTYATDADLTAHAATPHGGEGGSLPAGLIVMWGGVVTAIPSGWVLCDGQNGTPDLRSKFVKGAAAGSDPGATGGATTHTHADHTDVINHTHPITDPGHVHDEYRNSATTGGLDGWGAGDTSTNTATLTGYDTGSKVTGISVNNPASGVSALTHDSPNNEPPYYALCFIQKT